MLRTLYKDPERFKRSTGAVLQADENTWSTSPATAAKRDEEGYLWSSAGSTTS